MFFVNHNDYELIYLIKDGQEKALNMLYHKYTCLLIKLVNENRIKNYLKEDIIQDGLIRLNDVIYRYKNEYNISFYGYYILVFSRMVSNYYKRNRYGLNESNVYLSYDEYLETNNNTIERYTLSESKLCYSSHNQYSIKLSIINRMLNLEDKLKARIYQECFIEGFSIRGFSDKYGYNYHKVAHIYNNLKFEIKNILTIYEI